MGVVSDAGRSSGDLMHRVAALERAIRDLQTARRLEAAAVGTGGIRVHSGGSLRLEGGGSLVVGGGNIDVTEGTVRLLDAKGNVLVKVERTPAGGGEIATFHPNGTPHMIIGQLILQDTGEVVGQGFVAQQDNSLDLIGAGALTPGGPHGVRIRDHLGQLQFNTDLGTAGGLDRPFLSVPMYSNNSTGSYSLPAGQPETTIWIGQMYATHPNVHARILARVGASTTAEFRLKVSDVQVGPTLSTSSTSDVFLDFGVLAHGLATYSFAKLSITAVVTAGTNSAIVRPYGVYMKGTP